MNAECVVKRSQPRKKCGTAGAALRAQVAPDTPRMGRKRCIYPAEANTPEAHIEFLECLSDVINQRLVEVKRAYNKDAGET